MPDEEPREQVTVEWTVESYDRYRVTLSRDIWDDVTAIPGGAEDYLAGQEGSEHQYDGGVTRRLAYINDEEVLDTNE